MTLTAEYTSDTGRSDDTAAVVCNLDITGMTCASCVRRIEKSLNKVDGVAGAQVNLATEVATVTYDPRTVGLDELIGAVVASGYGATPRQDPSKTTDPAAPAAPASGGEDTAGRDRELNRMKRKWQVALTTGLGLMGLMYVPLYIDTMDWLMPAIFVVATAVQFWAGRSIYASAWQAATPPQHQHDHTRRARHRRRLDVQHVRHPVAGQAEQIGLPLHVYYETSLIIVALVLAGKWMEAPREEGDRRGRDRPRRARAEDRPGGARRARGRHPGRAGRRRRHRPHPSRGEDPRRRRRRRRHHHRRREHADRREPAGRQGRGRPAHRRDA